MKVAINIGGYHLIGTGHTYRQITMMEEMPEFEYFVFVNNKQNLSKNLLDENIIDYQLFGDNSDFYKKIEEIQPDIVINDFLDTTSEYVLSLKRLNCFVVNFEDRGDGIQYADIVINDMYELEDALPHIYSGYKYTCMRRDLQLYKPLTVKKDPPTIIITFGGSDPQNYTSRVLKLIMKHHIHDNFKIVVILGLGYIYDEEIYSLQGKNIKVLKNVNNMPALLQKADIGITANGRTLFEFAHFRVPCISLAQNEREKVHTFAKEENGVIFLGESHDFDDKLLLHSITKLLTHRRYCETLSQNMNKAYKVLENSNKNIWTLILDKFRYKSTDLIIQCRMNSQRLPQKATMMIHDKTLIEHVITRLSQCKFINNLILCTSVGNENDILEEIANKNKIKCFRGSEDNVLERFYKCTLKYKSKHVIRCTGDCPLIDPQLVDNLIKYYHDNEYNHVNFRNKDITRNNNFPDGFDAEIFSVDLLKEAYENSTSEFEREHVTPYIVKNYGKNYYKIPYISTFNMNITDFHYSVDTQDDFDKVTKVFDCLYPAKNDFTLYDMLVKYYKE